MVCVISFSSSTFAVLTYTNKYKICPSIFIEFLATTDQELFETVSFEIKFPFSQFPLVEIVIFGHFHLLHNNWLVFSMTDPQDKANNSLMSNNVHIFPQLPSTMQLPTTSQVPQTATISFLDGYDHFRIIFSCSLLS